MLKMQSDSKNLEGKNLSTGYIAGALAEKGILLQQDKLIIKYMCIITYDTVDLCHDNPPT
jgi:hypothetical protein